MSTGRRTPAQGLKDLYQQALDTLYKFASSARRAVDYQWKDNNKKRRAAFLINSIKRDLEEYTAQLNRIHEGHKRTITSGVLANPHHPTMLAAGGEYFNLLDEITATIGPWAVELVDLIDDDINDVPYKAAS